MLKRAKMSPAGACDHEAPVGTRFQLAHGGCPILQCLDQAWRCVSSECQPGSIVIDEDISRGEVAYVRSASTWRVSD